MGAIHQPRTVSLSLPASLVRLAHLPHAALCRSAPHAPAPQFSYSSLLGQWKGGSLHSPFPLHIANRRWRPESADGLQSPVLSKSCLLPSQPGRSVLVRQHV